MESFLVILKELVPIAQQAPWFLMVVAIVVAGWKISKFLGEKLFSDEKGMITVFFKNQNDFVSSMKEQSAKSQALLERQYGMMEDLKRHQIEVMSKVDANNEQIRYLKNQIIENINKKDSDKNLFTVLVDDTSLPLLFCDKNLKITKSNTALCILLGYNSDEIENINIKELVIEKNSPVDDILLSKVIVGEVDRHRIERTFISKTGKHISVAIHLFRYPKQGEFTSYVGMVFPLKHEDMIT